MARIRSVHPEQWTDDDFVTSSPLARLLSLGLRNHSDDNGIFERNPVKLKLRVLPADNCDVAALLEELRQSNQVFFFTAEGREFGMIRSFHRFQKPKYPSFIHPIPSEPLPKGYALSPRYSGSPTGTDDDERIVNPPALPKDTRKPVAGGEERRVVVEKKLQTPQAQAAPKVEAPRAPDPRETEMRSLLARHHVNLNGKGALHLRQWLTEGITTQQLTDAITLAREHKPEPQAIPAAYLAPIVADLRAGNVSPPSMSAEDTIREAKRLVAAKEAKELADSKLENSAAEAEEELEDTGDDAWWKPTASGEEALVYMGPELGVVSIAGQSLEDYRLRAIAAAGPGPWRQGLSRAQLQQVRAYEINGWNPEPPPRAQSTNVRRVG